MDQSKQQQQQSTRPHYIINLILKLQGSVMLRKSPTTHLPLYWHSHKLHCGTLQVLVLKVKSGLSPSAQVEHVKLTLCVCERHSSVGDDQVPSTSVMWSLHAQLCRGRITLPQKLQFYMVACLHVLVCGQLSKSQTLSVMKWQQPLLCLYKKLM